MKLNHINLVVPDVASAVAFFEKYFDFKCSAVKGDNIVAVLNGADGFVLVLMSANKQDSSVYPEAFHIGFMLDGAEAVNDVWQKLKNDGVVADGAPRKIRDSYGFYFTFDNLMIEVGHYLG